MSVLEERFWSKVDVQDEDSCWNWTAGTVRGGYGGFRVSQSGIGSKITAHKYSYELHNGKVPDGLLVCHTCDNVKCCNPKHLYAGTQKQNMQDRVTRGRSATKKGSNNGRAKLTHEQVSVIKRKLLKGSSLQELSFEYLVSVPTIWQIRRGKNWPEVDPAPDTACS